MLLSLCEIRGRKPGPHVLITAGVHGNDFEPVAAVRRLIKRLRPQELRGRVTLVPVVNEPACARSRGDGPRRSRARRLTGPVPRIECVQPTGKPELYFTRLE